MGSASARTNKVLENDDSAVLRSLPSVTLTFLITGSRCRRAGSSVLCEPATLGGLTVTKKQAGRQNGRVAGINLKLVIAQDYLDDTFMQFVSLKTDPLTSRYLFNIQLFNFLQSIQFHSTTTTGFFLSLCFNIFLKFSIYLQMNKHMYVIHAHVNFLRKQKSEHTERKKEKSFPRQRPSKLARVSLDKF